MGRLGGGCQGIICGNFGCCGGMTSPRLTPLGPAPLTN